MATHPSGPWNVMSCCMDMPRQTLHQAPKNTCEKTCAPLVPIHIRLHPTSKNMCAKYNVAAPREPGALGVSHPAGGLGMATMGVRWAGAGCHPLLGLGLGPDYSTYVTQTGVHGSYAPGPLLHDPSACSSPLASMARPQHTEPPPS